MVITSFGIIIFQLIERIAVDLTKITNDYECRNFLNFPYSAIPSRHEVSKYF